MKIIESIKNSSLLLKNFSSLTVLQFSNYFFPLITFPYLVRVLGPEKFGLINFAAAFVAYFSVLTDYGFNLSATREISIARKNSSRVNSIFSSVMTTKLILFFIGTIIFFLILFATPKLSENYLIFMATFPIVLGSVLFPIWFFQGMEEMKYITIINVGVKFLWFVSIFLFIKSSDDTLLLVLLNSGSLLIIGIISLLIIKWKFHVSFKLPLFSDVKKQLYEGWYYFVSSASITLYTNSNIFILGLFANNEIVGYFAAADKLRMAIQGLFGNAAQTVYPHLSLLFNESKMKAVGFVKKYIRLSVGVAVLVTALAFVFSEDIILIVLGKGYMNSLPIFRIILFLPIIILLSNIYGIQVMLNLGYKKEFFKVIFYAGIINLILSFILVPRYLATGTAIAVTITEIIVTLGMWNFTRKNNLLKSEG